MKTINVCWVGQVKTVEYFASKVFILFIEIAICIPRSETEYIYLSHTSPSDGHEGRLVTEALVS